MKISKKFLSVILAMIMIASCTSVAFADQTFSGTYTEDQVISSGATISDDAVFNCAVTISSGAKVENGTFNGAVTNNGEISGGTFNGDVLNSSMGNTSFEGFSNGIIGGTFNGNVTNAASASIGSGTFNGTVTNNGEISISLATITTPGTFNGVVNNNNKLAYGVYNNVVNNNSSVTGGTFYNVINNSSTVSSSVSALIKSGNSYTVQGTPTIGSNVTLSGKDATFTLEDGSILGINENGQLALNCACTINGTITLSEGAKLTSNGGSLTAGSAGTIKVPLNASFTGTTASKFNTITYKEYPITVESNVDANQFTFSVSESAYKGDTVIYALSWTDTHYGCVTINDITVYNGKKNENNIINKSSDISSDFTMPDNNVIIYVDCTANHTEKTDHKDATCTEYGYDRTYCEVCSHEISYTKINALGHQFSDWIRNTDSDSKMLKSRTCTRENCNYCEKSYIEIKGYDNQEVTVDYKSTLTFHYNVSVPDGCYIQWKKDNNSAFAANENGYTVEKATSDFTMTAIVYGAVNDTYKVTVHVNHGFFDKFVAFFRGLFGALPVYIDNVKQ